MARSAAARPRGRSSRLPRGRQGLFMRVAVGVLGMLVAVLTVFVSRRGVLLGLLMLTVGVVVSRLQVMVRGRVMVCGGLHVMFDRRVFVLLCHGCVLLQKLWNLGASRTAQTGISFRWAPGWAKTSGRPLSTCR